MLPLMELLATIGGVLSLPATVYGGYVFAKVFKQQHSQPEAPPETQAPHPGGQKETLESYLADFIEENSTDDGDLQVPQEIIDDGTLAEMLHVISEALRQDVHLAGEPDVPNPEPDLPEEEDIAGAASTDEIVFKPPDDIG